MTTLGEEASRPFTPEELQRLLNPPAGVLTERRIQDIAALHAEWHGRPPEDIDRAFAAAVLDVLEGDGE